MLNKSTLYCHNIKVVLCLILSNNRNGVLLVVSLEMFSGHVKILSLYSITLYKELSMRTEVDQCRHFTKLTKPSLYIKYSNLIPPTAGVNDFLLLVRHLHFKTIFQTFPYRVLWFYCREF